MRVLRIILKVIGVLFMVSAFWTWISFDYPDFFTQMAPFALFDRGMWSQMVNWLWVCVQGAIGYGFFKYSEKFRK